MSELLTLALFGQWARFPSEQAFYRFAQRHLKATFPMLPDHSQFVRDEHACAQLIEQIACLLASLRLGQSEELYQILDATGVPVRFHLLADETADLTGSDPRTDFAYDNE